MSEQLKAFRNGKNKPTVGLVDSSPMPFGKYKGDNMEDVPAHYLLWLYDNKKYNQAVLEYIESNYDVLLQESKSS